MADVNAISEGNEFANEKTARLEEEKYFNQTRRDEGKQNAFHHIFIVFVWVISGIGIMVISIRMLHLILPVTGQWLADIQVQAIDKLFFSGAIGGFIATSVKKEQAKSK